MPADQPLRKVERLVASAPPVGQRVPQFPPFTQHNEKKWLTTKTERCPKDYFEEHNQCGTIFEQLAGFFKHFLVHLRNFQFLSTKILVIKCPKCNATSSGLPNRLNQSKGRIESLPTPSLWAFASRSEDCLNGRSVIVCEPDSPPGWRAAGILAAIPSDRATRL